MKPIHSHNGNLPTEERGLEILLGLFPPSLFQLLKAKSTAVKKWNGEPALSIRATDVLPILVNSCPSSQELQEPSQKEAADLGKDRSAKSSSLCNY